jgi:D-alanyl-D-alanine carboxypeptidase/D-alanyl-D-alanine-endopeptidase (penicillin-binding protein 4)
LKENGIGVERPAITIAEAESSKDRKTIDTTYSPILKDIISRANKKSVNLLAEHLLLALRVPKDTSGSTRSSVNTLKAFWKSKGMDTDGLFMKDGSGLSRYDAVTPRQLVFILKYMKTKSQYFNSFYESLSIAGVDGTLRNIGLGTNAENNLRAKSGTIENVKSYSGYVTTKSGNMLAFAVIVNNFNCSSSEVSAKMANLMIKLANSN